MHSDSMLTAAVFLYLLITAGVLLFQAALAFGAPWGEYTMGGKWKGVLPLSVRIAVLFQMALILFFGFIVTAKSGLFFKEYTLLARSGIWFPFGFFAVGTVLNWITPSRKERYLWGPVNTVTFLLVTAVAFDFFQ